jgi:hypothetical protein
MVDVIDRAQFAAIKNGFDELEFARQPRMAAGRLEHDLRWRLLGSRNDLFDAFGRLRQRLLEQHVLSGRERRAQLFRVQVRRRGDDSRIHGRVGQDFAIIESPLFDAELLRCCFGRRFAGAVDPGDLRTWVLLETAHQHLAVHACADDPESVFFHLNFTSIFGLHKL